MRTTITLPDDTRQELQALAQARGDKGLSRIVEEAVLFYLAERNKPVVAAEPLPAPALGRWQRRDAELAPRLDGRARVFAMYPLLPWGGLFGMFGLLFWSNIMRRSLAQRA
jgi:Ribbon-helix-helix protein, copG family